MIPHAIHENRKVVNLLSHFTGCPPCPPSPPAANLRLASSSGTIFSSCRLPSRPRILGRSAPAIIVAHRLPPSLPKSGSCRGAEMCKAPGVDVDGAPVVCADNTSDSIDVVAVSVPTPSPPLVNPPLANVSQSFDSSEAYRRRFSDNLLSPAGKSLYNITKAAKKKVRRVSTQSLPGLPMASSLFDELKSGAPDDAVCMELWRDSILLTFANPVVGKIIITLAILVSIAVVGFGLLICWTMLGLFFEIDNGWGATRDVCLNSTGWNASTATGTSVPKLDGKYITDFCNLNQWWFNQCVKVFVILFSYINFLPIPWRLSCLWHVYCSRRPSEAGVDFYGRPTDALWFNLPRTTRRRISLGLNLAWIFHFVSLATHIVWPEYIEGQTFPGVLFHNLPFVLSLFFQITAASAQDKAERKLIAEDPERFSPKPLDLVILGWRKWRSGEAQGRLIDVIKQQFREAVDPAIPRGGLSSGLTGIQRAALKPRARRHSAASPGGSVARAAEQPIPGLPMPPSLREVLSETSPEDSTCMEVARDRVLYAFAHPMVSQVFFGLAVGVSLAVLAFTGLMVWCILGLFFEVDNGWGDTIEVCLNSTGWNATSLDRFVDVPKLDGKYITGFCNLNQYWFNVCIKVFVILFTYINFLPIPWRLSCLWHVYCSRRPSEAGVDFYGRPTDALWFNLPRTTRRRISLGLNLAWMFHFAALATHIVWPEYIESTTWPHVVYQNLPEILSLIFQLTAGRAQARAEARLIAEDPERFPPKPLTLVLLGWRKWRSGEEQGSLRQVIRQQFTQECSCSVSASRLTGIVTPRRTSTPGRLRPAAQSSSQLIVEWSSTAEDPAPQREHGDATRTPALKRFQLSAISSCSVCSSDSSTSSRTNERPLSTPPPLRAQATGGPCLPSLVAHGM